MVYVNLNSCLAFCMAASLTSLPLSILGKYAEMIPMAALAAVLFQVAFNMCGYRSFIKMFKAPKILTTAASLPWASMMMARDAPLKGVKLLTASPLLPVKKPLLLAISEPSAEKVFRVNTDFVAFFTHDGWATEAMKVNCNVKSISIKRFIIL